jgi:hypothetical protein
MLLFSIIAVIYMSVHEGDKYDEWSFPITQ